MDQGTLIDSTMESDPATINNLISALAPPCIYYSKKSYRVWNILIPPYKILVDLANQIFPLI